jgi:hypothetical protein
MGVAACLLFTAACSHRPAIAGPRLHGADAAACRALVKALPRHVDDQPRRAVSGRYGAAWGDPPIVLTCGVRRPKGDNRFAACTVANGVGWFVPESASSTSPEIVITTIGRAQNVQVAIPHGYFPPAATMADLAPAIKHTIRQVHPCV